MGKRSRADLEVSIDSLAARVKTLEQALAKSSESPKAGGAAVSYPSCFFMICTDKTERECLDRNLLGDREGSIKCTQDVQSGYFGFLQNVDTDELIGVFQAEGAGQLDIVPKAWGGRFPAQVKVRPVTGRLYRVPEAEAKLEQIVRLRRFGRYRAPTRKVHGPDVTAAILSLFPEHARAAIDEELARM